MRNFLLFISILFVFGTETSVAITGNVVGTVTEGESNTPLPNVNVYVPNANYGTITDEAGHFRLRLPAGEYTLRFENIGYATQTRKIDVPESGLVQLEITLTLRPLEMKGIIVEEEKHAKYLSTHYRLGQETIQEIPPLGEPDVLSVVKSLPGIIQTNDLTGNLYVRGGAADQNQILLDGVAIDHPYHLFGLFSGINAWAVGTFRVFPADFPVKYSGKLSSVIDIRTKSPRSGQHGTVNLSLVSSSAVYTNHWKNQWLLIAGRRTNIDFITALFNKSIPYKFYDANLKYIYAFSDEVQFRLYGFYNNDSFDPTIRSLNDANKTNPNLKNNWGNKMVAVEFARDVENSLATVRYSYSQNFILMSDPENYQVDNILEHRTLRGDVIQEFDKHTVHTGFYLRKENLSYQWDGNYLIEQIFYQDIPRDFAYDYEKYNYGIYLQDDRHLFGKLRASGGVIWDNWGDYETFSPRLNFRWLFDKYSSLSLSIGYYYQPFSQGAVPREGSIVAPIFHNSKPSKARTVSLGYEKELNEYYNYSMELYQRTFEDIVEIRTDETFPMFRYGSGNAYGLDGMFKKGLGDFTFQISGSIQKNEVTFQDTTFTPDWDTPYALSGILSYRFNSVWSINTQTTYQSGTPYTPVIEKYLKFLDPRKGNDIGDMKITFVNGAKNSARLSDYFRFDVSLQYKDTWGPVDYMVYLQVLNLFNTGNILRYSWYDYYYSVSQGECNQTGTVTAMPVIPSLGIALNF